eukprot:gene29059-38467_t
MESSVSENNPADVVDPSEGSLPHWTNALAYLSQNEQSAPLLESTDDEAWAIFYPKYLQYKSRMGARPLIHLFQTTAMSSYLIFLGVSAQQLSTSTDAEVISLIEEYHNVKNILDFNNLLKSFSMKAGQKFDNKSAQQYMEAFIIIINAYPSIQNLKLGGGSQRQLVNLFISGIQPASAQQLLRKSDPRTLKACYTNWKIVISDALK